MGYFTGAQRFDVICVGDVATDQFIQLPDQAVRVQRGEHESWLMLPLGAKLPIDRPTTVEAGGTAANASVAMARLGLRVSLAAHLAHDHFGLDLLTSLHAEGVDTRLVRVDTPARTNRNYVLSHRGERTILVHHEAFNYHWPHLRPSEVPSWLYLASLGPGAAEYHEQLVDWLELNPQVRLAFQPGTYQVAGGSQHVRRLYKRTDVLCTTAPDARLITGLGTGDIGDLLGALNELGPRHVVLCLDRGAGAASEGPQRWRVSAFPDASDPLDRTGAEDAFAATVVAALVRGEDMGTALRWAPVNYMNVSHSFGSQSGLLRTGELEALLVEEREFVAVAS